MWEQLAKYAVKFAVWAIAHPDTIRKVVEEAIALKHAIKK